MPQEVIKIRLVPTDPHWINLDDPYKSASEIDDWWENNATYYHLQRGFIELKIPEVKDRGGIIKIKWWASYGYEIGLCISRDGIWGADILRKAGTTLPESTYEMELNPDYVHYAIFFIDGIGANEMTRVHKDVEVVLAPPCPLPNCDFKVTLTAPPPLPPPKFAITDFEVKIEK